MTAASEGGDVLAGTLIGIISGAITGGPLFNGIIAAAGNLAGQTNDPCFKGFNFAEAAAAGLLGKLGLRGKLPQFTQPNLIGNIGTQAVVEGAAQAASKAFNSRVAGAVGLLFNEQGNYGQNNHDNIQCLCNYL